MPHYRDGTAAQVGDIVRGKGYNVKHEIVGRVVAVKPGDTCNIEVACVSAGSRTWKDDYGQVRVDATIEYGETAAFEKIA